VTLVTYFLNIANLVSVIYGPTWMHVAAAIPAAVMLWILISWSPSGRRQWLVAAAMTVYVALYYFLFVRHG
jgi:hypothetical protein